jgi:sec-independent protein translocase protein TatC
MARRIVRRVRPIAPDEHLSTEEHLTELRDRMLVCAGVLAVAFGAMYLARAPLLRLLVAPLPHAHHKLSTFSPTEPFTTTMGAVFWSSVVISLPVLIYQVYAFAAPALTGPSKRRMIVTAGALSGLFIGGVAFTYVVVLPTALRFLLGFGGSAFDVQLRANEYLSFVTTLLIAGGIVFELPVVMLSLSRLGIADTRTFTRHRRFAVILMTVVAAVLPGGDAVSMLMLLGAEVLLYEVGIVACRVVGTPTLRARLGEVA